MASLDLMSLPDKLRNGIDPNPVDGRHEYDQAAILMTRTGRVYFEEVEAEAGGQMPALPEIYNKALLRWFIRKPGDGYATCMKTLAKDIQPGGRIYKLLEIIHRGHSVTMGDNGDEKGKLSDDAAEALDELAELLVDYPIDDGAPKQIIAADYLKECDLADLGIDIGKLDPLADDATLRKAVDTMCSLAADENLEIVRSSALRQLREKIEFQLEMNDS